MAKNKYLNLPRDSEDINWDKVSDHYDETVLSPFHSSMSLPDSNGLIRNRLVSELLELPESLVNQYLIADLGCGTGNLLAACSSVIKNVHGLDNSLASLDKAKARAEALNVKFTPHKIDMRTMDIGIEFDIIIVANSILPTNRGDVLRILERIKMHLKPTGRLMAIMPSYDTTLYLQDLTYNKILKETADEAYAENFVKELRVKHLVDDDKLLYADDEKNIQCYHTPDSICNEIAQAGLHLVKPPRKIYYPWPLTKQFGYGDFPEAKEEIWDWYIEVRKC